MVFSNLPQLELFVNGKSIGRQGPDNYATFIWNSVNLAEGDNTIEVRSVQKKNSITDQVIWNCK